MTVTTYDVQMERYTEPHTLDNPEEDSETEKLKKKIIELQQELFTLESPSTIRDVQMEAIHESLSGE